MFKLRRDLPFLQGINYLIVLNVLELINNAVKKAKIKQVEHYFIVKLV